MIKELVKEKVTADVIKNIIHPTLSELEVQEKKKAWVEMHSLKSK